MRERIGVLISDLDFPEGPAFDAEGNLWLVELKGGSLGRITEEGLVRYRIGGSPNGLAVNFNDHIMICDAGNNCIRLFDEEGNRCQDVISSINGSPLDKPNDLLFDGAGNLLFTCPGDSRTVPTGYVCCLCNQGTLKVIHRNMYFPNGIALSDGGHTLIVAETYRQRLWKGTWDSQRAVWVNPQPWVDVGGAVGPDGIALARDGLLYVALFGSGQIIGVDAEGCIQKRIELPGTRPTNLAFDPFDRLGLVVTEAERGQLLSITGLGPGVLLHRGRQAQ